MSDFMKREYTPTGFVRLAFTDRYDQTCSVQESSLATEEALWVGLDDADPKVMAAHAASVGVHTTETTGWVPYPIPDIVLLKTRMHLTRPQAAELAAVLAHFADTGNLP